eukprot:CAMPEP_0206612980 /NCGR_PEP_ID=MMETSP0325_2-20121206/56367_1 /ASSEMBLY_ACC=CAM_ASM_000347 /TAXON_ID=2866 /ORGANISM="Crypthecodinium cohnii, Strain Seligo" /LENGTH=222 /DNA_ID=CAMNT_0054132885 /DNA_START=1 /DNA_END=669 /DNA_ORIENTATION=-
MVWTSVQMLFWSLISLCILLPVTGSATATATAAEFDPSWLWHSLFRDEPTREPTVKEKIWDMGEELCKDRPDNPLCDRFGKAAAAEEAEKAEIIEPEEETLEPKAAPAPAPEPETTPAPAPAPAPETTKKTTTTTTTQALTTKPPPSTSGIRYVKTEERLGIKRHHQDGETVTGDWGKEYPGPPPPKKLPKPEHGGSDGLRYGLVSSVLMMLAAFAHDTIRC